jgi:predicted PurR-regulated permease PerM
MTGVVIAGALMMIGHKYWVLWGFLAFLLNYIPNVGSIIAAIPAVVVAVATMGQFDAALTVTAYVFANVTIGSILEPKILGDKLGLSTLVILVSMLFWGFLFGTVGMFLSIPITISIKILLGDDNKFAKLLGN